MLVARSFGDVDFDTVASGFRDVGGGAEWLGYHLVVVESSGGWFLV